MKQRFLSIFTVVALMASVIAGAMGVSVRYAKADEPSSYGVGYFGDLAAEARESCPATRLVYFDALCAYVGEHFDNSFVVVIHDENTSNWYFGVYTFDSNTPAVKWGFVDSNYNRVKALASNNYTYNFYCQFAISWTSNSSSVASNPPKYIDYAYAGVSYGSSQMYVVPSPTDTSVNGRLCYANQALTAWNGGLWDSYWIPNLLNGYAPPQYVYFDLGVFWLGNRQYLSILQQDIMRDLDPEHLNEASLIVYLYKGGEGDYVEYTYSDVTLIPGDWQYFVNLNFSNVSPQGLYVIDITGNEWDIITGGEIVHFDEDYETYAISDSRIEMNQGVPGTDGTPDSYTQSFNYFSEYVNNYNQTHVIPENLADTLFGLNGSRLYPCSVSVPKSVWNSNSTGASNQLSDQHNWKWWFASRSDLGMNFELMDVVIISESATGQYSLLYYYSDTLNNPFQYVQNLSFQDLFENFDIVIIVPDDLNCLNGNTWWKDLLETICQNLGIQNLSNNLLSSLGISGSDSLGVEYVQSQPSDVAGVLQGFCIVTKKAIQRQQLYVFNDGITKTYKLMSDYIEKRGNWEDSFLTWTASLFSQWQTLDGKLGDIYNLLYGWNLSSVLSDISESLARIAANTSEEDPGYWFLSLFNWLNRFSITDSDFANWVSEYDDFTDDLPDPGTGATVIPFPTAIPTVAVGG